MKALHYRPRVQNGSVVKRRTASASTKTNSKAVEKATRSRRSSSRKAKPQEPGSRVLWILMLVGATVAVGFILAVRSQINVHRLEQAETSLKSEFDRVSDHQRFLLLDQQRALSLRESNRAAKQSGLVQPKFNQQTVARIQAAQAAPIVPPTKVKKERANPRQQTRTSQRR